MACCTYQTPLPPGCSVAMSIQFCLKSHPHTVSYNPDPNVASTPATNGISMSYDAAVMNIQRRRKTLHISSMSPWAPVCIGPYSQCNTLCHGIISHVAGQIALNPGTMSLSSTAQSSTLGEIYQTLAEQLFVSMQNSHRILTSLNCACSTIKGTSNIVCVQLYISRHQLSLLFKDQPARPIDGDNAASAGSNTGIIHVVSATSGYSSN